MTKVAQLTSAHPKTAGRIRKQCETLAAAGYQVVFVVPDKLAEKQQTEQAAHFSFRYILPAKTRWQRFTLTLWRVLKAALKEKAEIYHFHDPDLILVGIVLKAFGKKVIYDVHEDFAAQVADQYWIPRFLKPIVSTMIKVIEPLSARLFNGMICATETIAKKFPAKKTVVVRNYPLLADLPKAVTKASGTTKQVVYTGLIARSRCVIEMLEMLAYLPEDIKFVMAGQFENIELEKIMRSHRFWSRVDYRGLLSNAEVYQLLSQATVSLAFYKQLKNLLEGYPTKVFEAMAMGVPVIVTEVPLWQEIISNPRCGILVNSEEPKAIAQAIEYLFANPAEINEMAANGQTAIKQRYNWTTQAKKLIELYKRI